ncbi:MAG: MFS transporter [Anaerolineae bacterium]
MGNTTLAERSRWDWRHVFAALQHRNYRLWFSGQIVSLAGTWMQSTAQGYLIYDLTRSTAYLGYVSFAAGIPTWLLILYAGVVADRVPRRTLLVITQSAMTLLALALAGLTFLGWVRPWHVLVLAVLLSVANAFDAPARLAIVNDLVDRKDLTNAIALNSTIFNAAVIAGPALGGLVYAHFGPGWCFTFNGLSFLAIITGLLLMRLEPQQPRQRGRSAASDLREGLRYVAGHGTIRLIMLLVGIISLFGISYVTLVPAWAVNVLRGDATTNGLLHAARGAGALIGALSIAALGRFRFRGRLLTFGSLAYPVALFGFSLMRQLPLAMGALVLVGLAQILTMNLANSLVQSLSADELRGRVMSIYSLLLFGLMPVGGLLVGSVATVLPEPQVLAIGAGTTLLAALFIAIFAPRLKAQE